MSRHGQNGLSFVPTKILTWVPREARGGLKAIAVKRQQPYKFIFMLPYIIMDLPIFVIAEWATLLVDIHCPRGGS